MKSGIGLSAYIGQRLSLRRDSGRTSAGVLIAVSGIAVSFIVMLLAISIVQGFRNEIINKLSGFNSQISITAAFNDQATGEARPVSLTDSLYNRIADRLPTDASISLSASQPAVFKTDGAFMGVVLRGLSVNAPWDFIKSNITEGTIPSFSSTTENQTVVISSIMAEALGVKCGDKLPTHFFNGNSLRSRNLLVSGIYNSHFSDFDKLLAFTPISTIQRLHNLDSITGSAINIDNIPYSSLTETSSALYDTLLQYAVDEAAKTSSTPNILRVDTVNDNCAMYVNWLELLNTNVIVIITLMAFVAGFTLISSLFIIILERVNMIGLFKALGATNSQIRSIFIYMAQRLVVRGLIIGNIIGIGLVLVQKQWHLLPLNPEAYYLSFVPVCFSIETVIILNIAVIAVATLILILPSHLISTLSPTKSMKFE